MAKKSSAKNNPGKKNQEKSMEEHHHQPISSEIKDNQKKGQNENNLSAPEIEADFVLGDLIEKLLHKDHNNPAIDKKNDADSQPAQSDPLKVENNSIVFDISDATVDSYLEQNMNIEEETQLPSPEDLISNDSQKANDSQVSEFKMVNDKLKYLYNGVNFYLKKNYEHAIIELKKGLKIDPESKLVYLLLGNSFFRNNMLTEARSIYEKLKKKFPVDSLVTENLGLIYRKQGMYQLAEKEWDALLKIEPEKIEFKSKVEKSPHNSCQNLEKSVAKNGEEMAKLINDGINFYKNKDYDSAIDAFKGAINRYPDKTDAYNFLANTYFRKKMLKEAILTYENFINKYKGNISAHENIGLLYAKQGEYNKAIDEWEKVIITNPERQDIKKKIERVLQLI